MRLALIAAAALIVLLALGALLWLAPARSLESEQAPATGEATDASGAELEPAGASGGGPRVPLPRPPQATPATEDEDSAPGALAADAGMAEVVVSIVAEEDGAPLGRVVLYAEPWPQSPAATEPEPVFSDDLGRARFRLPAGGARIVCRTQLDRALVLELAAGEQRAATLHLRRDADLDFHLQVADADTGAPIAKALVEVGHFPDVRGASAGGRADDLGILALRLPSWGVLSCRVSADGYGPVHVQLAGDHARREQAKVVLLARAAGLEGVVRDENGEGISLAHVTARAARRALDARNPDLLNEPLLLPLEQEEWAIASVAGGRYELPGLPAGVDLTLEVRVRGELLLQEDAALRLGPGEVRVHDLRLAAPGAIEGVLLAADGAPCSMVPVVLLQGSEPRMLRFGEPCFAQTLTNTKGRFAFQRVQPGTWLIGPQNVKWGVSRADRPVPLAQVVELPAGVPVLEVELRLPATLYIQGSCVGPDAEPVGGATVFTTAGGVYVEAASGEDGTFALGPLPAVECELCAQKGKELTLGERLLVPAGSEGVLLRLGAGARIHGAVVDAKGAGQAAQVQSILRRADGSSLLADHATDAAGAFELTGLTAGRYVLVARTATGLASKPRAVTVGPSDDLAVDLAVEPGGQVRLRLPAGEATATILVDGERVDFVAEKDGTTRALPPGPITIELADSAGVLLTREASVAAGAVVEVDLR